MSAFVVSDDVVIISADGIVNILCSLLIVGSYNRNENSKSNFIKDQAQQKK